MYVHDACIYICVFLYDMNVLYDIYVCICIYVYVYLYTLYDMCVHDACMFHRPPLVRPSCIRGLVSCQGLESIHRRELIIGL